jgi:hypothetical protein
MRWEMLEQMGERERESAMCIRIEQTRIEDSGANRRTTARVVEEVREQCFQQAEAFTPGDIRYPGFEDKDGLGRVMITMRRR